MSRESQDFLLNMLRTPSPSGFESRVQELWRDYVTPMASSYGCDPMGNMWGKLISSGEQGPKVMVVGHCDEIGLMVTNVTGRGFLHVDGIGGIDPGVIVGSQISFVHSGAVGVVGRRPVHLVDTDEAAEEKKILKAKDLYVDVGAAGRDEAEDIAPVGSAAVSSVDPRRMGSGGKFLTGRGLDNRLGSYVAAEVLHTCRKGRDSGRPLHSTLISLSSVQEELGFHGAKVAADRLAPHAAIVVDATFATDTPDEQDKKVAGDVALGRGPVVNIGARVNKRLSKLLVEMDTPHQVQAVPGNTGTDADVVTLSNCGIPTAVLSIPLRYMHTPVETCCPGDVEAAIKMISELVFMIGDEPSVVL